LLGEGEQEPVRSRPDGAGGEKLVEEHLRSITGDSVQGGICASSAVGEEGGCWWKRVWVVGKEMCQVEGIWNGFRDYHGSVTFVSCLSGTKRCKLSHGFSGFDIVDFGTEAT